MTCVKNRKVYFQDWGLIDYESALQRQFNYFNETINTKVSNRALSLVDQKTTDNYLIFCQHKHVYTLGKSGSKENLLINENELKLKGVDYVEIGRGGDITYHGPGQVVGYPILDLDNFFTDIHKYMRCLEEVVIRLMAGYGLEGKRIPSFTGVWLEDPGNKNARKICAFGIKLSRWVSMHGFSLNVNTNLDYFDNIVPCGIRDKQVTSLEKELGRTLNIVEVQEKLLKHMSDIFEMEIVRI